MEPNDPIKEIRVLSNDYRNMSQVFSESSDGYRARLYTFLRKCYHAIKLFSESPQEYQRLKDDEFWDNSRQKPKDQFIAKWVLYYVMQAKSKVVRDRAGKCAKVLDSFLRQGMPVRLMDARLRALGGVDKIYAKLCAGAPRDELKFDDLELLKPATPDQERDESDGFEDEEAEASEDAARGPSAGGLINGVANALVAVDERTTADQGPREPVAALRTASERDDVIADENQKEGKRGHLNRIDLKTTLAVEMTEEELEEALAAKKVVICAFIEPPDERGWRRVVAQLVFSSAYVEGPWPGSAIYSSAEKNGEFEVERRAQGDA
jgi:hypothetical protein